MANPIETKDSLGTPWNWTKSVLGSSTVYVIEADSRTYRIARDTVEKDMWRADRFEAPFWEALNANHYATPEDAAKAIIRSHKASTRRK